MATCTVKEYCHITRGLSDPVMRLIAQIAIKVMNKNIHIEDEEAVEELSRYKTELRGLTRPKTFSRHRELMEQEGGFLPTLLSIAVPLLSSVIEGLILKH